MGSTFIKARLAITVHPFFPAMCVDVFNSRSSAIFEVGSRGKTTHNVAIDPDSNLYVIHEGNGITICRDEKPWQQGKFVQPHDACFDRKKNIYVAEGVCSGRVTKLTRVQPQHRSESV